MEDEWSVYTGEEDFTRREDLRRIRVAPHVTAIPRAAFLGCRGLREVDLGNVTQIGYGAFAKCTQLQDIDLSNVTEIGYGTLFGCTELRNIRLRDVKTIGSRAFYCCSNLAAVELPEGLRTIGQNAFSGTGLKSIAIPSTVMKIGFIAFEWCTNLREVTLCEGPRAIIQAAFRGCGKLESVVIPSTVVDIGPHAFNQCTAMTALDLPEGVQTIRSAAFGRCHKLERVSVSSSVTEIGDWAFYLCSKLAEVRITDGIQTFGERTFERCPLLKRVDIPSPAFVISVGNADRLLECQLVRDASISPLHLPVMVVSRFVKSMSVGHLEKAQRRVNEILATPWRTKDGRLSLIRKLFEYYELHDATSVLELAIWGNKILSVSNAPGVCKKNNQKRARIDSSAHRNQCRTDSGAHIILPLVMPFVGPRVWGGEVLL